MSHFLPIHFYLWPWLLSTLVLLSGVMPAVGAATTMEASVTPSSLPLNPEPDTLRMPSSDRLPPSEAAAPTPLPSTDRPGPYVDPASAYPLEGYGLTVGDIVFVTVVNVPDYSGTFQVLPDGSLNLPVLGRVPVWGLTLTATEQAIAAGYAQADILVQPKITVSLTQISPLRIAIIGEVNRPGLYTVPPDQGRLPTVAIALDTAGGITQHTDLRHIQVRRIQANNHQEQVFTVSLWDVLTQGDRNQDLPLRDGDTILVPAATGIDVATATELATSTFSPATVRVNIVGEITQPGVMEVPPDTPLNQALLLAGGFTPRSRSNDVELLRLNPDGTVSKRAIAIDLNNATNDATNPILQDRDVILVGKSFSADVSDRLGSILQPLTGAFSLFNLFLPFFVL